MTKPKKNPPVPPPHHKGYAARLRKLKAGESELLPVDIVKAGRIAQFVFGPGGYRSRSEDGGVRVWRVA